MKTLPAHPSLYQINTRVWLTELSRSLGRAATLDDIPDTELDRMAGLGFGVSHGAADQGENAARQSAQGRARTLTLVSPVSEVEEVS